MSREQAFEATFAVDAVPQSNALSMRIGDAILVAMPTETSAAGSAALVGLNVRTGLRGSFLPEHVRPVAMPMQVARGSSNESLRARARHLNSSAQSVANNNNNNSNAPVSTSPRSHAPVSNSALASSSDAPASAAPITSADSAAIPPGSPVLLRINASAASVASSGSPVSSPPLSPVRSRAAKPLPVVPAPVAEPAVVPVAKKAPRDRQNRKTIIQRVSAVFTGKRKTSDPIKKLHHRAAKQFEQKKFDDALASLTLIVNSPSSEQFRDRALFNMCLCHAALGRVDEALKAMAQALAAGYNSFSNFQHPYFSTLQDNPEFFSLLSRYLNKSEQTAPVIPTDQQTEYGTAPTLSGFEMLVSPDVEYEPIPVFAGGEGDDDMDLADGNDEDETLDLQVNAAVEQIAREDEGNENDEGDGEDSDGERLIDRRKLPSAPSAPPEDDAVPLDAELPQPPPPLSSVMMNLSETANRLASAGRAADARRVYGRMLALHPKSGAVYALWANLEAQVNDKYEACRLLKLAATCGFTNWASIERQPAFAPVLALPECVELLSEIREKAAAAAATVHSETRLD